MEEDRDDLQAQPKALNAGKLHLFRELPPVLRVVILSASSLFILAIIAGCVQFVFFMYPCFGHWWNPFEYMPYHETLAMYSFTILYIVSLYACGVSVLGFLVGQACVAFGKLRFRVHLTWAGIQLLLFLVCVFQIVATPQVTE